MTAWPPLKLDPDWPAAFRKLQTMKENRLGVDFVRASRPTIEHQEITIKQNVNHKSIGAVVWDSAIFMCEILDQAQKWIQDKDVVELGSGTGIVGIYAAKIGAKSCLLTDKENITTLLKENIHSNKLQHKVQAKTFSWGETNTKNTFDIIICSDLLYDHRNHQQLVQSIVQLSKIHTVVIFTLKARFPE